jgi:hypothetical protein
MSSSRLVVVALLTPRRGAEEAFRACEAQATTPVAREGGGIERVICEEVHVS